MSEKTGGFFARSNEPCADKTDDSRWELAHNRMADGLDAYGERRDSLKLQSSAETCRHGLLQERKSQMKRYLRDHSDMNLLPSGEIKEPESITDDQILMNNKAV